MKLVVSLFWLLATSSAWAAEKHLLLMGGGGEPQKENSTLFDDTLKKMDGFVADPSWKYSVSFNGGHKGTEAILETRFPKALSKGSFTPEKYQELLNEYLRKIESGEIAKGDQLLIMVDSHGSMRHGESRTHKVAVNPRPKDELDPDSLKGITTVSLDALQSLVNAAKDKGVKIAIVDHSCHSGNTLALADESVCVISATGPAHYGYGAFSEAFAQNMKPGKSLEAVFLETRQAENRPSFPMISTPEGQEVQARLHDRISPYLFYANEATKADKLSPYIEKLASGGPRLLCHREEQFNDLMSLLDSLQNVKNSLAQAEAPPAFQRLQELLREYKENQDSILHLLRELGSEQLSRVETFTGSGKFGGLPGKSKVEYTWGEILAKDVDAQIEDIKRVRKIATEPENRAELDAALIAWDKLKKKKKDILAEYPSLRNYPEQFKILMKQIKDSYDQAAKIATEERKLYHALYEESAKERNQPNACKNFVL